MNNNIKDIQKIKEAILNKSFLAFAFLGIPTLGTSLLRMYNSGWTNLYLFQIFFVVLLWVFFLFREKISFDVKVFLLSSLGMVAGLMGAYNWGLLGGWLVLITLPPVVFSLFYGKKYGIYTILIAGAVLMINAFAFHNDATMLRHVTDEKISFLWINTIVTYMFLTAPLVILVGETGRLLENHINMLKDKSEELERSREYLLSTIDFLPVAIGIAAPDGRMIKLNKRFVDLFGYGIYDIPTLDEWYKKAFPDEDYRDEAKEVLDKCVSVARQHHINVPPRILRITGAKMDELHVEISVKMIKEQLVFAFRDLTARIEYEKSIEQKKEELKRQNKAYKELNRELEESNSKMSEINASLKKAKKKAEESDKFKTYFLKNISHEIRTPLNGIMGFSEMLRQKNISIEDRELYADFVISSGKQFLSIIDKVISLADLEAGNEEINKREVNLKAILKEMYDNFEHEAKFKNISLVVDEPGSDIPEIVILDGQKVKIVFSNLIENAIKFTNEGEVRFGCSVVKDKKISFYVKDTGIGIPVKNQKIIFDRFMQGGPDIMKNYGGAGLGLAIISSVLKLLGGTTKVASKVGEGSTFTFSLPLEVPAAVPVK
jgi:signal transduction histidine kinase